MQKVCAEQLIVANSIHLHANTRLRHGHPGTCSSSMVCAIHAFQALLTAPGSPETRPLAVVSSILRSRDKTLSTAAGNSRTFGYALRECRFIKAIEQLEAPAPAVCDMLRKGPVGISSPKF